MKEKFNSIGEYIDFLEQRSADNDLRNKRRKPSLGYDLGTAVLRHTKTFGDDETSTEIMKIANQQFRFDENARRLGGEERQKKAELN